MNNFAPPLRLRIKRNISYQEVAAVAGCNAGHMNEIENGKQNPTLNTLRAIADFHKIKLSKMLALTERKYERGLAAKKGAKEKTTSS